MDRVKDALTHSAALDPASQKTLVYSLTAAGLAAVGATVWWFARDTYYEHVPMRYQYRPGTFTGWMSKQLDRHAKRRRSRRPIRVYMDGCFDLMHYGHANALRQAAALGDELVVGLVPDSEIRRCKGPPILNENERLKLVQSVKWVDEVITNVPYDLTPEFLEILFHKHKIDYVIHGDDPCILPDGTDAYAHAKKLGKFRMIKRTEGVSTTDIVGRMLLCMRSDSLKVPADEEGKMPLTDAFSQRMSGNYGTDDSSGYSSSLEGDATSSVSTNTALMTSTPNRHKRGESISEVRVSRFMPTSRRIVQFSSGNSAPQGARIVYIDGAFDLFHVGHVEVLHLARSQGDFLLVGIHTDEEVCERRGPHQTIMGLHERALSVLACKYADEVIIGAPGVISEDLLTTFGIDCVVRGTIHETMDRSSEARRYELPVQKGMFARMESPSDVTSSTIIKRIVGNRAQFEERQARKAKSEAEYYKTAKNYVEEV